MESFMMLNSAGILLFLSVCTQHSAAFFVNASCGQALYSKSGTISSPSYAVTSPPRNSSEACEWRITAPTEERILLNVTELDIEKSPNCSLGYLEVRAGYWYDSPLLGRLCGQGPVDPIISTTNKMFISYVYNNPSRHRGFAANYEEICGDDFFVDTEANFTTPNYPDSYPLNKKCIWRIIVHEDKKVALRFNDFELENQTDCLYDSVEVRDGLRFKSNPTGVYCNSRPQDIISSNSTLLVKFVSDATVQKRGFFATILNDMDECAAMTHRCAQICINTAGSYRCECRDGFQLHSNGRDCEVACGGTLTTTSGTIKSPSYPAVYPLNRSCSWDIVTDSLHKININFSTFDLENGSTNGTCDKDVLKVFVNSTFTSSMQFRNEYCGNVTPATTTFVGRTARIVFNSDSSIQRKGFVLNWTTESMDLCAFNNGNCRQGCLNANGTTRCVCTANFDLINGLDCVNGATQYAEIASLSGNLSTPNYPSNYPNNADYRWLLTTTPGHRLNVTFPYVETEGCTDKLQPYDGPTISSTMLPVICTNSVRQIYSSTNELYMRFTSDASITKKGFLLTYSPVCGGSLQATSTPPKYIYSHANFGHSVYDASSDCEWTITADAGYTIELSFSIFQLEPHVQCRYDYVEIFLANNSSAPSFGKYCGSNQPPRIVSESNFAKIKFHTDATVSDVGFSLKYQAVSA